MGNPLFAKKPLKLLLEEAESDNRLRRILGKWQLTGLGVGATIIMLVLLAYQTDTTWPGLVIVLLGVPVFLAWGGRAAPAPAAET